MSEKREYKKVFAEGLAMYASVHKPKKGYTEKDAPKYCLDLVVDKKTETELKSHGIAQAMLKLGGVREYPEHPGKAVFRFTRKTLKADGTENTPPEVLDSETNVIPDNILIGNGSLVKVSVSPWKFDNKSGTVLLGVQVIELVPYTSDSGSGLEKTKGFTVPKAVQPSAFADTVSDSDDSPFED